MKIKILFITTSYGSYFDSQTIRYFQYLSKIDENSISVDFIVPNCDDENFEMFKQFKFNYRIFKTKKFLYQRVSTIFKKDSFLGKVIKNISYYFFFPDTFAGFQKVIFKKYKEIYKNNHPDVVISSSGSCSSHLACLKIKNKYNIRWIADFGDPWSITDYKQRIWFYPLSKKYEQKIFKSSDLVLFTTYETLKFYKVLYPNVKMEVLFYGFMSEHFDSISPKKEKNNLIKIAHIGAAYVSDRNLIPSIKVLSEFSQKVVFSIIGNHSFKFQECANELKFNVNFKDRVSFEQSLIEISNTDILILVGNKSNLQIPGKVFHYIASNKIILYIYQCDLKDDPSYVILKDFEGIYLCENNFESIKSKLGYIINNFDLCKESSERRRAKAKGLGYESYGLGQQLIKYLNVNYE